jgi:hypothetical protein
MLNPTLTFGEALDVPAARTVLASYLPNFTSSSSVALLRELPVSLFVYAVPALRDEPERRERFWAELDHAMDNGPSVCRVDATSTSNAPMHTAVHASATWTATTSPARWDLLEISLTGPAHGNPFRDVDLSAEFTCGDRSWVAGGFYDGDGIYRVRVLAELAGTWAFRTRSNEPSLDGIRGEVHVSDARPGAHGPVRVDGFHFRYADGRRYRPMGTTAYAWTHQSDEMQQQTLDTLARGRFTKLRMCLFPKHYLYNQDEPRRFPFLTRPDGSIDIERFDLEYFRRLDTQIEALAALGLQADIILFHPYDRWGFADLGPDVDDRWVRYVVHRFAGYANVWWSMANEYDLMTKTEEDWDRLGRLVSSEDPHHHLISIHNGFDFFDHGRDWVTHASIQGSEVESVGAWRERWGKPVVVDECSYEGDLEYTWGCITGEEMVRRLWEGAVRGGYIGHGETYFNDRHRLWWSRGGELVGTSHQRFGFLDDIAAAAPDGILEPVQSGFDAQWAGSQDRYLVAYFGVYRPREKHVLLPPGDWVIDVLDTWNCTVDRLPGTHVDFALVPLPSRSYMAVRVTRLHEERDAERN